MGPSPAALTCAVVCSDAGAVWVIFVPAGDERLLMLLISSVDGPFVRLHDSLFVVMSLFLWSYVCTCVRLFVS